MLKILKALEPYDGNMKVLTKKEVGVPGLGLDPAEVNANNAKRLDYGPPAVSLNSVCSEAGGFCPSCALKLQPFCTRMVKSAQKRELLF